LLAGANSYVLRLQQRDRSSWPLFWLESYSKYDGGYFPQSPNI
jgi:hypothetical protein